MKVASLLKTFSTYEIAHGPPGAKRDTAVTLQGIPDLLQGSTKKQKGTTLPIPSTFQSFLLKANRGGWNPSGLWHSLFPSLYTLWYYWWYGVIKQQKQSLQQSRNDIVCHKQQYTIFEQDAKCVSYILQKNPKGCFLQMYHVMCLSVKILMQSSKSYPNRI